MTKRKDPAEKKKAGRKSKKDEINREGLKLCYTRGFTDADTALALQITGETLINWRKQDPEFFATLAVFGVMLHLGFIDHCRL